MIQKKSSPMDEADALTALNAAGTAFEKEESRRNALAEDAAWSMLVQNISAIVNSASEDTEMGAMPGGSGITAHVVLASTVGAELVAAQEARNIVNVRQDERNAALAANARRKKAARRQAWQETEDKRHEHKFDVAADGQGYVCKRCEKAVPRTGRAGHVVKCRGVSKKTRRKERARPLAEQRNVRSERLASSGSAESQMESLVHYRIMHCPQCYSSFHSEAEVARHAMTCTSVTKAVQCTQCSRSFRCEADVARHTRFCTRAASNAQRAIARAIAGRSRQTDLSDGDGDEEEGVKTVVARGETEGGSSSSSASPTPRCAWCVHFITADISCGSC